jgi:hypothetical protein
MKKLSSRIVGSMAVAIAPYPPSIAKINPDTTRAAQK